MTTQQSTTDRQALEVRTWERGTGSPVVYLHGFAGFVDGDEFLEGLASHHRVIAPEHPGFGGSTGIDEIDDVIDMALHYRRFIERTATGPVDLVGHSLGGMFAAEVAALCPQLVRRLVLIAPFGLWLDDHPTPDLFAISPNRLQQATWADAESRAAQEFLTRLGNAGGGGIDAIVERAMNLSAAGKFLWPLPDRGLRKRFSFIEAPTLVIAGKGDQLVPPRYCEEFAGAIAGARMATVAGAGHYPTVEQREATRSLVTEFLAG